MKRLDSSAPRVQALRKQLIHLLCLYGTVNELANQLNATEVDGDNTIYPHRLHAIFNPEQNRQINATTITRIETACSNLKEPVTGVIDPTQLRAAALNCHQHEEAFADVAAKYGVPLGVVQYLHQDGKEALPISEKQKKYNTQEPDWSWQAQAITSALASLARSNATRAGLIIPTGGGKTRIALKVCQQWATTRQGTIVWVTHRKLLKEQAEGELLELIKKEGLSRGDAESLMARIKFAMVHQVHTDFKNLSQDASLFILDEAHNAATQQWSNVFTQTNIPILLLTATPNRTDGHGIGLTEIAYQTTYADLIERRCLMPPVFEEVVEIRDLNWDSPKGLKTLAEFLLDQTESKFYKPLVTTHRKEDAEKLFESLDAQLKVRTGHHLTLDEIGFVHSGGNSHPAKIDTSDFLKYFRAQQKGILIATTSLIGEGYNDPSIDAVVFTKGSTSATSLMQVAGRALRYAPGKKSAHIIQIRESSLEYNIEQGWIYQDISDQLRPALVNRSYATIEDRQQLLLEILKKHNVEQKTIDDILISATTLPPDADLRMMLMGTTYFGSTQDFQTESKWECLLITPSNRSYFLDIFNDISYRTARSFVSDSRSYLKTKLPAGVSSSEFSKFDHLMIAAQNAYEEINMPPQRIHRARPYQQGKSCTWLTYVTVKQDRQVNRDLELFLETTFNRENLLTTYAANPSDYGSAVRLPLPIDGYIGYLLSVSQTQWLNSFLDEVRVALLAFGRDKTLDEMDRILNSLPELQVPRRIVDAFVLLTRNEDRPKYLLNLDPGSYHSPAKDNSLQHTAQLNRSLQSD